MSPVSSKGTGRRPVRTRNDGQGIGSLVSACRLMAAPKPSLIHCNGWRGSFGPRFCTVRIEDRGQADRSGRRGRLSFRYGHFTWLLWSRSRAMDQTFHRIAASASSSAGIWGFVFLDLTAAPTAMNSTPGRFEGGDHAFSPAIECPVYPVKI